MPVLPSEANLYPFNLFDSEMEQGDRRWWVMHTKPRQEKAFARSMVHHRIPFYLPLMEKKTIVRGRVLTSHLPLFTSYVFFLGSGDERVTALSTKHVVRSIEVRGQQDLSRELSQVYQLIRSGLPLTPEQQLYPGAEVEITTGPLMGLRGVIIREASRKRFVVQVNFIQQGASVVLDDFALAAIRE